MKRILCIMIGLAWFAYLPAQDVILKNNMGVEWTIAKTTQGYSFGSIVFNGKPVEAPLMKGIINFLNVRKTNNGD